MFEDNGLVQGASRSDLDRNNLLRSACCYEIAVIGEAVKAAFSGHT